jgi:hypothetical protein
MAFRGSTKGSTLTRLSYTVLALRAAAVSPGTWCRRASSVPADSPANLVSILCYLFENWLSDGILARGGGGVAKMRCVDAEVDRATRRPL